MKIGDKEFSDELNLKSEFFVKFYLIQHPDFNDKKYSTVFAIENEDDNFFKFYYHVMDITRSYIMNDIQQFKFPVKDDDNTQDSNIEVINEFLIKKLEDLKIKIDKYEEFKTNLKEISNNKKD